MAKKSKIAKNLERHKIVDRYAEKRKELKSRLENLYAGRLICLSLVVP